MGKLFCGVPLRINILIMLYLNLIWNIYMVCGYLYSFNDENGLTDELGFNKLMTSLSIISLVYLTAIITIHKKEIYMLSPTIIVLVLDIFCLMYFYVRLIDLHLIETWQSIADQTIENVPQFFRNLIEQGMLTIFLIILSFPLSFKILSVMMLRFYRNKLRESSTMFPPFAEVTLHFSAPPSYEECVDKEYISDSSLPPYSRLPI
ncbi:uncharacterized protein LOC135834616 [Planococcus citri]|uniref:uncharacterized protein LOC135834616 n=1 Tax=Planococcus citri TaxID=170843 RepID=UPI0031F81A26